MDALKSIPFDVQVSIVIPIKDEEENIIPLSSEINEIMESEGWNWECLWINDGSIDKTGIVLNQLVSQNPHHRMISFATNQGQSVALWHGFQCSKGQIIVTLDGDGQNDPKDIPLLVKRVFKGHTDVANGYRQKRNDSWHKRYASCIANGCRNALTGSSVRDVGCSIRAIRSACVKHLPLFRGLHRFLPTLFAYQGYRLEEWPVNHRPRERGHTKYTINNRLWVGLVDLFGVFWLRNRGFFASLELLENKEVVSGETTRGGEIPILLNHKDSDAH